MGCAAAHHMDELPPEHAGRIGLSLGLEPILTSLGGLERRVRTSWRRDAGAHRTRGLIPRPLRWVNWSATGRARHRLRVRGAGHGRGELAQVIVAVGRRQVADLSWGVMQLIGQFRCSCPGARAGVRAVRGLLPVPGWGRPRGRRARRRARRCRVRTPRPAPSAAARS